MKLEHKKNEVRYGYNAEDYQNSNLSVYNAIR
jgi:hypothetical protein